MKKLMLGNAAAARGLYEAGCAVVSSYPGTPSTEITEELAAAAGEAALEGAEPFEANRYKIQIAKTLVKRTLLELAK